MSPWHSEEASGLELAGTPTRAGAAVLIVLAVILAGLVILGMATGTHRQFDEGEADLWVVISVQVLGVMSLLALVGVMRACIGVWQGHRHRILRWTALAIPVWLIWALLRVGEYAS